MGLLLYPGNRCEGGPGPIVECNATAYNTFEYVITNATSAHWRQSSDPDTHHPITLVDGAATGEISADSTDTYIVCADQCGICTEACCTFNCLDITTYECNRCWEEGTLLPVDFTTVQITITDGGVTNLYISEAPFDECTATCSDWSGTYIVDVCDPCLMGKFVFLCTIDDVDYYMYTYLNIFVNGFGQIEVNISTGVGGVITIDPPEDFECGTAFDWDFGVPIYYATTRTWIWDQDTVITENVCTGEEDIEVRLCTPLDMLDEGMTTSPTGGCTIIYNYTVELDEIFPL